MKVTILNSGSSSIKYAVFDMSTCALLGSGLLERIGSDDSRLRHRRRNPSGGFDEIVRTKAIAEHRAGFDFILSVASELRILSDPGELFGIGHRVVHGGEVYREAVLIDQEVIANIGEFAPLAPLHNPANLKGIEVVLEICPGVPQVAVFDTAFHQTMSPHSFHYALPRALYREHHVRRYGFHGNSHGYVAKRAAKMLGKPLEAVNLITLHLGNGVSAAAVRNGKSIDTSMGMTPLEGLMMGTRCGDVDPAIHFYLARKTGMSLDEIETMMNTESGLKGICGVNDMREVESRAAANDPDARLAFDMFCYRIRKCIGAYCAVLQRVDALVFTAGIGENSPAVRRGVCDGLALLGIVVDEQKNQSGSGKETEIQDDRSPIKVLVIPTNEELEIAHQAVETIKRARGDG
jgi:acetate kinase